MDALGVGLTLERSIDSISRGVVTVERFPSSRDFRLCFVIDGFAIACPFCDSRLGDLRTLLREVAATDRLHPPVLLRILQEVQEAQASNRTHCFCRLSDSLSSSNEILYDRTDVQEAKVFDLPSARLVSGVPQPADFLIARDLPSIEKHRAISFFRGSVHQPIQSASLGIADPGKIVDRSKRNKAYRNQAEEFQSTLGNYHRKSAQILQSAVGINDQIYEQMHGPAAIPEELHHALDPLPEFDLHRIISIRSGRACPLLDEVDVRFTQESDAVKQKRIRLIQAIQALTAELVLYPGMNSQLVSHVAQVPDPSLDEQAVFLRSQQ